MKKRFTQTGTPTTKNETSRSKLTLSRETLRYLSAPELARVVGGTEAETHPENTCMRTCVSTV